MTKFRDDMSVEERFAWHTEVYAWRRVRLGVSRDERSSPPDPQGVWFNADMVDEAECRLRQTIDGKLQAAKAQDLADAREASAIEDGWAQKRGYADFEDYKAREQINHVDAACNVARSLIAAALLKGKEAFGEPDAADPKALLKALGVTAKEVDYSPETMRRARIALGIEEPDDLLPPGLDANGQPTGSGEAPLRPEAAE